MTVATQEPNRRRVLVTNAAIIGLIVIVADLLAQGWMALSGVKLDSLRNGANGAELGVCITICLVGLRMVFAGGDRVRAGRLLEPFEPPRPAIASQAIALRVYGIVIWLGVLPAIGLIMADIAHWRPPLAVGLAALASMVTVVSAVFGAAVGLARQLDEFQRQNFTRLALTGSFLSLAGVTVWFAARQLGIAPAASIGDLSTALLMIWGVAALNAFKGDGGLISRR